jgi:hypothetical protein
VLGVSNGCHSYVSIQKSFAFGNGSNRNMVLTFAIENQKKTVSLLYTKKNKKSKAIIYNKPFHRRRVDTQKTASIQDRSVLSKHRVGF